MWPLGWGRCSPRDVPASCPVQRSLSSGTCSLLPQTYWCSAHIHTQESVINQSWCLSFMINNRSIINMQGKYSDSEMSYLDGCDVKRCCNAKHRHYDGLVFLIDEDLHISNVLFPGHLGYVLIWHVWLAGSGGVTQGYVLCVCCYSTWDTSLHSMTNRNNLLLNLLSSFLLRQTTLGLLIHLIGQFFLMGPPLLLSCHLILTNPRAARAHVQHMVFRLMFLCISRKAHILWFCLSAGRRHELLYPAAPLRYLPPPHHHLHRHSVDVYEKNTVKTSKQMMDSMPGQKDKWIKITLRKIPTFLIFFLTGVRMVAWSSWRHTTL